MSKDEQELEYARLRKLVKSLKDEVKSRSFNDNIELRDVDHLLTRSVHDFMGGGITDPMYLMATIVIAQDMLRATRNHQENLRREVTRVFSDSRDIVLEVM